MYMCILCVKKQLDLWKLIVFHKNICMYIWKFLMNFQSYFKGFENFVSYKLEFLYKFNISLRYRRNINIYIMMCVNGLITKFPKGHFSHQLIEGLTIYWCKLNVCIIMSDCFSVNYETKYACFALVHAIQRQREWSVTSLAGNIFLP